MTTWTIDRLHTQDSPNVKTVVAVDYTAALNGHSISGRVDLDPPGQSFTEFAALTQAQVLEWLWGKVSQEATEALLASRATTTTEESVPWQS